VQEAPKEALETDSGIILRELRCLGDLPWARFRHVHER
jgi:hypothetical protein